MKRLAFALFAVLAIAPARADESMEKVANSFYATYASLPRSGGIPDATTRVRYAPLLSPRLSKLIADAVAAEARFMKKNRNSPPLIEGDLFSSLFEGATSAKLGACSGDTKTGSCTAALTYTAPGQKPVSWNDMVLLVNTPQGWKVDDIAYKAGFQFGNEGLLSDTLRMAINESP